MRAPNYFSKNQNSILDYGAIAQLVGRLHGFLRQENAKAFLVKTGMSRKANPGSARGHTSGVN